jgi:hypothetical protein
MSLWLKVVSPRSVTPRLSRTKTPLRSSHRPRQKTHPPLPLLLNAKDNEDGAHKRIRSSLPGKPFAWYVPQPIEACCRLGNENAAP